MRGWCEQSTFSRSLAYSSSCKHYDTYILPGIRFWGFGDWESSMGDLGRCTFNLQHEYVCSTSIFCSTDAVFYGTVRFGVGGWGLRFSPGAAPGDKHCGACLAGRWGGEGALVG